METLPETRLETIPESFPEKPQVHHTILQNKSQHGKIKKIKFVGFYKYWPLVLM